MAHLWGSRMNDERWLPIPGFPGYEASDHGRVRSRRRKRRDGGPLILQTGLNPAGYQTVNPWAAGRGNVTKPIHYFVMLAFVGPRPADLVTRHLDGNQLNNHLTNLAYGTVAENQQDAVRHGTHNNVAKTRCPQGHPYDDANTLTTREGDRKCRECVRARSQAWRDRQREIAGPPRRGEQHWAAKVSDAAVAEMREMYRNGWTVGALARKFEIDNSSVSRLVHNLYRQDGVA